MNMCSKALSRKTSILAAACTVLASGASAWAQQSDGLIVDLGMCVDLDSPGARFDCYERQVQQALEQRRAALRAEPPGAATVTEPRSAQNDAAVTARAPADSPQVGASTPAGRARPAARSDGSGRAATSGSARAEALEPAPERDSVSAPAARDEASAEVEEITSVIADLRERVPNSYLITLENGQIWRQVQPRFYALRTGQNVRIYQGGWTDSFRLTVPELNGFIRVERVR